MKVLFFISVATFMGWIALPGSQEDDLARSIARGKVIYNENCITCHLGKGEGVPGINPPLAKADYLMKDSTGMVIKALKFGLSGKIKVNGVTYDNAMPQPGLDHDEIADVINYIRNSWGNSSQNKMVTSKMVEAVK